MTIFIEEPCVSVVEVAKRVGQTVDEVKAGGRRTQSVYWCGLGACGGTGRAGPYALVDGSARRDQEHRDAWYRHTVALQQWQKEREKVRSQVSIRRGRPEFGLAAITGLRPIWGIRRPGRL
jgi:hypothetical protein